MDHSKFVVYSIYTLYTCCTPCSGVSRSSLEGGLSITNYLSINILDRLKTKIQRQRYVLVITQQQNLLLTIIIPDNNSIQVVIN